ncbi:MAG: response regulator [Deltaproteobacteria bacterium HGW-Deltaproteobacteria-6]|nr:MAG: response regulator [Deltaproteobacteria bacterium HGW-Deltaproteobacteria-6]
MSAGRSPAADLTAHKIKVLLIDDQAIVGVAVKRMLEPETDIVFEFCQDPTQAIPTAIEFKPTVILQDLIMPDIDGLTLVKFFRVQSQLKDVPLIVLSSKEEAETKADAFALGANDYMVKLPDRIELIARIRYHSQGYINLLQRNEAYAALLASRQALATELAQAADYVVSLMPEPIPEGNIKTAWRFFPSAQLGGDSFGYHWIDEDNFAVYLLDVCGHGVGSALLSVSAFNAIRSQTLPNTDFRIPEKVLAALNDAFLMEHHNNLYFTIWYGVFNRSTRKLSFASGGHPPAFLVSKEGKMTHLFTNNMFIGGLPESLYKGDAVSVPAGAHLYVFSDGVYEVDAPGVKMWTLEELGGYLLENRLNKGEDIDALYRKMQAYHGQDILEDDFSMMAIHFA